MNTKKIPPVVRADAEIVGHRSWNADILTALDVLVDPPLHSRRGDPADVERRHESLVSRKARA